MPKKTDNKSSQINYDLFPLLADDTKQELRKRPLRGYRKWEAEAPRQKNTLSAKRILEVLADHLGYHDRIRQSSAVTLWPSVVGDTISAMTEPITLKEGVLRVRVTDPAWRQELSYTKGEIIHRLNHAVGAEVVSDIKFS